MKNEIYFTGPFQPSGISEADIREQAASLGKFADSEQSSECELHTTCTGNTNCG